MNKIMEDPIVKSTLNNVSSHVSDLSTEKFYGKQRSVNTHRIKCILEQKEQGLKKKAAPLEYIPRFDESSTVWQVFRRQSDALELLHSKPEDFHVFSYESESFAGNSGKRLFLVCSYEKFWHYYSQLTQIQRHHYEVIPEDYPCNLYFDLEFLRQENSSSDGQRMTSTLIKVIKVAVLHAYGFVVNDSDIIILDSSTAIKFSQHVIIRLQDAVFHNNIHAGNFVKAVIHQISTLIAVSAQKNEQKLSTSYNNNNSHHHSHHLHVLSDNNAYHSTEFLPATNESSPNPDESGNKEPERINDLRLLPDSEIKFLNYAMSYDDNDNTAEASLPDINTTNTSSSSPCKLETTDSSSATLNKLFTAGYIKRFASLKSLHWNMFLDAGITKQDLDELFVNNSDKNSVSFCDLGVYSRNRNFRLYLSSKLDKNNPLVVYQPQGGSTVDDYNTFLSSLITNVRWLQTPTVLYYTSDETYARNSEDFSKPIKQLSKSAVVSGYHNSPYPDIDEFIATLISGVEVQGHIRRWSLLRGLSFLQYDILGYRYCENVGRQHKSNNIVINVDLSRGVYYQTCYDPVCRAENFKSTEYELPLELINTVTMNPAISGFEVTDEQLLNATMEAEEQFLDNSLVDDDDDDKLLLSAVDAALTGC